MASNLAGFGAELLAEFVEVESGKLEDRPELARALAECRVRKATLVIRGSIASPAMRTSCSGCNDPDRLYRGGYAERKSVDGQHDGDGRRGGAAGNLGAGPRQHSPQRKRGA